MKNSKKWCLFLIAFIISCSSVDKKRTVSAIPIHFLSCSDSPLLKVSIEGKQYTLKIDLGSNSDLTLMPRVIDQIRDKKFECTSIWCDIQGNKYESSKYKLPVFKIGHLRIKDALATKEEEFFITTGSKVFGSTKRRTDEQLRLIDGRVGCSVFHSSVCFFDLSHALFFFELNMEDMKKHMSFEDYIEAPFDFDKGLVCIDLLTEEGVKKFILDTGANRSAVKTSSGCLGIRTNQLQFESVNLGNWEFCSVNFPEKWDWADGILGMDFFKKFQICLDFPNRKIYLKRTRTIWNLLQ